MCHPLLFTASLVGLLLFVYIVITTIDYFVYKRK